MKKIIIFIILVAVFIGIVFLALRFGRKNNPVQALPDVSLAGGGQDSMPDVAAPVITKVHATTNTFVHKVYGFSLNYPSDMKVSNFMEGAGEQILFQNTDKSEWFQIYVTPWDESGDITVARIKKDLPDIVINSPQTVIIGPQQKAGIGPKALIFFSTDAGLGETREVWFAYGGNLYQITTYKKLDAMIGQILSTLAFK